MHNTRDPKYIAAVNASPNKHYSIFADRTAANVSWVHPDYANRQLPGILDELRQIYRQKTGQAPQEQDRIREITDKKTGLKKTVTTAGWSPIREGVCPILAETRIDDFAPFIEWLQHKGVHVIRIDLHHDEGHTDLLTGIRQYNHHAHIVCDWVNHDTGKTAKLSKQDMTEAQTRLASALRMERGISKTITGADHLSPDQQRAKAAAEEVKKLETKKSELEQNVATTAKIVMGVKAAAVTTLQSVCTQLQKSSKETVKSFDTICKLAIEPTKAEIDSRNKLEQEATGALPDDITALQSKAAILHDLLLQVTTAIHRIGHRLQKLAKDIPFWKKPRLAQKAALEAQISAAEQKAEEATKMEKWALNRAKECETQASETLEQLRRSNRLKESAENKLDNIADHLTLLDDAYVNFLERKGLKDDVGRDRWEHFKGVNERVKKKQGQSL